MSDYLRHLAHIEWNRTRHVGFFWNTFWRSIFSLKELNFYAFKVWVSAWLHFDAVAVWDLDTL